MANLCNLCRSIPFETLPTFDQNSYHRNLSGRRHLQILFKRRPPEGEDDKPKPLGFEHHKDLKGLRAAAKGGCELCRLIELQSDALLSELETRKEQDKWRKRTFPRFDLWIAKRADDQDGIWVLTNNLEAKDSRIILLAAFAYCADEDDPLAEVIRGRIIRESPKDVALSRVNTWVAACDKHERCASTDRTMPTRVIDVGNHNTEESIRLIDTSGKQEERYIALSYCWGSQAKHFTTTEDTLSERKQGIDIKSLPKTFQDAVFLTRMLGVRYLWVDSLCICQGRIEEWERESSKISMVYANAYLTISATGVDNSDGGLLFSRQTRMGVQIPRQSGSVKGSLWMCALPVDKEHIKYYHVDMRSEPLSQRAWCFQERVLSRRVLHFAHDQIYFECLEGTFAEDGLRLPHRFPYATLEVGEAKSIATSSNAHEPSNATLMDWYKLIEDYGRRKLTYPRDKLPAISGIAKIYQELLQDEYLAGVWKKTILSGICWHSLECYEPPGGYRAPSWSWAAVDGRTATLFHEDRKPVAKLIDSHVQIDGINPFGRVKDAWIKVSAPLVPLILSDSLGPVGNMLLRTRKSDSVGSPAGFDTINRSFGASAELVGSMELYALVILQTPSDTGTVYHSLIVTPTATGNGVMKRMGLLMHDQKDFDCDELSSQAVVTLV